MAIKRLLLIIVGAVVCVSLPAMAQQASQQVSYLGASRASYSIYFFGDTLAGGLWAGSTRMSQGNPRITTKGRYKEGSGLTRPVFYDWPAAVKPIIERNNVDIAVVLIGINDGQPVRLADRELPVASKEWREHYQGRVDAMITALKDMKVPVYWVELPPMANPVKDEVTKLVSAVQRERAEAAGVRFIEIRKHFLKEDGTYTDSGRDVEGQFRRLRSRDGVHFIRSGNNKIARMLLDVIERDIAVADGTVQPEPEDVATQTPVAAPGGKPIFGREMNLGVANIVDPNDLPRADEVSIARMVTTGAAGVGTVDMNDTSTGAETVKRLRESVPGDSDARRLFVTGEWPQPQPGRFDDFSVVTE
jgi:hypothetical protein